EGPALLDEFRRRTLTDARRTQIETLIRQLGDEAFDVRENAEVELLKVGQPALALLRQAVNDPDVEIRQRAQKCLRTLEKGPATNAPAAVSRLVALRKPEGAAEAVLGFIPYADDETTLSEAQSALAALALREDGQPEPALLKALEDKTPARRAA